MAKQPKTTNEHIISLYGYITGLKREVSTIKNNHLKHIHEDIDKLHGKIDKVFYANTRWSWSNNTNINRFILLIGENMMEEH